MTERKYPAASDPDNVPETICDGAFNVAIFGQLATLTFTHVRPDPGILLKDGSLELKSVVRARIVIRTYLKIASGRGRAISVG
jgi:hypothetical protein